MSLSQFASTTSVHTVKDDDPDMESAPVKVTFSSNLELFISKQKLVIERRAPVLP